MLLNAVFVYMYSQSSFDLQTVLSDKRLAQSTLTIIIRTLIALVLSFQPFVIHCAFFSSMHSVDDEKASLTFPCFQSMQYATLKCFQNLGNSGAINSLLLFIMY